MKLRKVYALALALCLGVSLFGCGTYKDANKVTDIHSSEMENNPNDGDMENPSSVTVSFKGIPFKDLEGIHAQWTDGYSYHHAAFDEKGVAQVGGLDGDFRVTLSGLPEGYSYNPNAYVSTNKDRTVDIELYEIVQPDSGTGAGLYQKDGCYQLSKPGVYRTLVNNAEHVVFYEFEPRRSGTYVIESWVDVTPEEINPYVDVYNGSFAAKWYSHKLEDGGSSAGYTRNFKHVVEIADEMIGNSFTFAIGSAVKNNKYPVTVDFAITLDGEFYLDHIEYEMITPKQINGRAKDYGFGYTLKNPEVRINGNYVFDGTRFAYNEKTGYYHCYGEEYVGYTETYSDGTTLTFDDGYGPIVHAYVSQPCRFIDKSFDHIEDDGNKALTVNQGTECYKMFIQGYAALASMGHVWVDGLTKIEKDYYSGVTGYAQNTNSKGLYPVTPELKDFLTKFTISSKYFADGDGWVESQFEVFADDEDQWLFACAYYAKN